jgi:DNA-binding transcriptional LysR family regulator
MPSSVTLLQLEYFVAAVEHGSFSAAATALHVAQPSLSEQIRRLEDRLGVVLFVRTNRRLVLTDAGHLLPRARSVLVAAEGVADVVRPVRTPAIEVELPAAAVALAVRGVADAVVSRALLAATDVEGRLGWAPLDPPMFETFAFVTSGSRLSPATQEMIKIAAELLRRAAGPGRP